MNESTATPVKSALKNRELLVFTLLGGVIGLALPWLSVDGASLQPGAYDLAEWLTLLPAVRVNNAFLLPALLLRLTWVWLGIVLSLQYAVAGIRLKVVVLIVLAGIALALVPPVDFFRGQFQDANYQQQFAIWALFLVAVILGIIVSQRRGWRLWGTLVGLGSALSCGLAGAVWGQMLWQRYGLAVNYGWGVAVYVVMLSAALLLTLINLRDWSGKAKRPT